MNAYIPHISTYARTGSTYYVGTYYVRIMGPHPPSPGPGPHVGGSGGSGPRRCKRPPPRAPRRAAPRAPRRNSIRICEMSILTCLTFLASVSIILTLLLSLLGLIKFLPTAYAYAYAYSSIRRPMCGGRLPGNSDRRPRGPRKWGARTMNG